MGLINNAKTMRIPEWANPADYHEMMTAEESYVAAQEIDEMVRAYDIEQFQKQIQMIIEEAKNNAIDVDTASRIYDGACSHQTTMWGYISDCVQKCSEQENELQ